MTVSFSTGKSVRATKVPAPGAYDGEHARRRLLSIIVYGAALIAATFGREQIGAGLPQ